MSDITLTAIAYDEDGEEIARKDFDHIDLAGQWAYERLADGETYAVEIEAETGAQVDYLTADVLAA